MSASNAKNVRPRRLRPAPFGKRGEIAAKPGIALGREKDRESWNISRGGPLVRCSREVRQTMSSPRSKTTFPAPARTPHAASVVQPKAPPPSLPARPPHPATVAQRNVALPDYRARVAPPKTAQRSTKGETEENEPSEMVFVVVPTRRDYDFDQFDEVIMQKQFDETTKSAEGDIKYLKGVYENATVWSKVIYTGSNKYGDDGSENTTLSDCINIASKSKAKVVFTFTAHGTPGAKGTIGIGWSVEDKGNPKGLVYRLTLKELDQILRKSGIERLASHDVTFRFHCCNSAYVSLGKQYTNEFKETQKVQVENDILKKSLIGEFSKLVSKLGFSKLTVIGYRGYYSGTTNGPALSLNSSAAKDADDMLVTITDGKVSLSNKMAALRDETELNKYV